MGSRFGYDKSRKTADIAVSLLTRELLQESKEFNHQSITIMKRYKMPALLITILFQLTGCQPKILSYTIEPARTVGLDQPVKLSWKVRGKATLLISDAKYDERDGSPIAPLTLSVMGKNGLQSLPLAPGKTDTIHLESEGTLKIVKMPDGIIDARVRTFALVTTTDDGTKPDFQRPAVSILPDSATSEIANRRTAVHGDTLIARQDNDSVRWGQFRIISVRNTSDRPLVVTHSGITRMLLPGGAPDDGFRDTLVKGDWEMRGLKSPAEEADSRLYAKFFKILIIVKP